MAVRASGERTSEHTRENSTTAWASLGSGAVVIVTAESPSGERTLARIVTPTTSRRIPIFGACIGRG